MTSAEIVKTKGGRQPFKVVFSKEGATIAERPVASYEAGRLIADLLPLLQKHDGH